MSFRIDRIRRAVSVRRSRGAESEEDAQAAEPARLPVPVGPAVSVPRPELNDGEASFAAQLMGQDGQKRGLRAGQPLLDAARKLYSQVEWSGARDRRARKGRKARDIA
jgi:hypothetical protein